jgi:methyl-accepting chemotaxis protein
MRLIREEVEGIAERIVDLSERHAQISDIVENVNAIAEQSNLLAVNASIEAAKAGEHGRGFAVVASEVRSLAERSKEATQQIRSILGEIQRSSNSAVMVTEQGVKRVDRGNELIEELGHGVETLARTIQEGSEASQQISLISSQQLAGIRQITDALRNVEEAASGNAAGAQQLEEAARKLQTVSERIVVIVRGTQS